MINNIEDLSEAFDILLTKYRKVLNSDTILDTRYYDQMSYDYDGFYSSFYESYDEGDEHECNELYESLKIQVKHAEALRKAIEAYNTRFC